jgi:hypothetical protein
LSVFVRFRAPLHLQRAVEPTRQQLLLASTSASKRWLTCGVYGHRMYWGIVDFLYVAAEGVAAQANGRA